MLAIIETYMIASAFGGGLILASIILFVLSLTSPNEIESETLFT